MKDPTSPVRQPQKISSWFRASRGTLAVVVIFGLLFNCFTVLTPAFQGRMLDAAAAQLGVAETVRRVGQFLLFVALVQASRYLKRYFVRRFANKTSASMRAMVYHHLLSRSAAELDGVPAGDLMARAVGDVDLCVEGMRKATTEVFDSGVLLLSYLAVMCLYDWRITLTACALVPVALLLAQKLKSVVYRFSAACRAQNSEVASQTYDAVTAALLLRVNGLQEQWQTQYEQSLSQLQARAIRADILENAMQPIYQAIACLGVAAVILLGGGRVLDGSWTIGTFSAYLSMFLALTVKAGKSAQLLNAVQKARASWKRVLPYLTEFRPFPPRETAPAADTLTVENLSFRYADGVENAVCGVNLRARTGMLIGITGAVACGKSALGLALLGLYPYEGSICIGARELRGMTAAQRSRAVAYMGHDAQLLSGTIYENVTLGDGGDIMPVLAEVCFLEDLAAMPDGVQTRVGAGGTRLSGGQQARLALARTLYQNSRVLVLDDPFAAVDRDTERQIIANLRARRADRIVLLISHRLAVFPQADEVLLLEHGTVCARGSHAQLLQKSARYREIYRLQQGESA